MENIQLHIDSDGVAIASIDVAGRTMNVFTPELTADLSTLVAKVKADDNIRGLVIRSNKDNAFIAGADLMDFVHTYDKGLSNKECAQLVEPASDALRALEQLAKPVAVAINGLALGGGFELCLACHYRVLVKHPKAVVGLPEVTIGLLPGGGGTQRLPRLIGIPKALPLLLSGKHVSGDEALALGMVDALADADEVVEVARQWVLNNPDWQVPWDQRGFKVPDGVGAMAGHSMDSFGMGIAKLRGQTQDNYPAPIAIMKAVYEGTMVPLDRALKIERGYFGQLLGGPVARNLMRTMFVNRGAARKLENRPADIAKHPVQKLGVLGAGMMGAGIAQVSAQAGIDVVLLDTTVEQAAAGKDKIAKGLGRAVDKGRTDQASVDALLARIHTTADFADLAGCDFVVEAVFEDRGVKAEAYKNTLSGLGEQVEGFVMASNTSTLPVTSLAEGWATPEEFIGVHFFSPVDRMPIVEVIRGAKTSDHALARAMDFVAQLRKIPIVVNDSPGFYTSRIFCAYIDEGMAMLQEGVLPAVIENAGKQAGFATPPLAVTDEVSLDLQQRVINQSAADGLDEKFLRLHAIPVVEKMNALGRLGRKTGGGFYQFEPGQPKRLWPGLADHFAPAAQQPPYADVKNRLLYIQALESARCVEEGVVIASADGDLGSILALGYPTWTGGTLSFIETVGPAAFVAECDRLADLYGERFRPSAWLRERATGRSVFY